MTSTAAPQRQLVESLLDALQALPGAHAALRFLEGPSTPSGYRPDAEISLEMAGRQYALRVEAKRELFPRDAREVLWRMDRSASAHDGLAIVRMVAADSLSPGAKDLLKAEGVGYFDRGGSLYLPAPGAYVYIDKPPPKSIAKAIGSLFTGRRAQVIHALLSHPREWLTGKELAERAQASPATVSQVMTQLERLELIAPSEQGARKGRQLQEPGRLLDQWAEYVKALKPPMFRRYFLPSLHAEQLLEAVTRAFAAHGVPYAVSFEAAAQAYAPFLSSLTHVKCRAISGTALESGLAALNARVVEEGANFSVLETKSAGDLLFRQRLEGTWLASPIQVYLDLLRSEGRAKELAQNLRRERIPF
jgi:DNA-binding transcriptional ArsR family regulator